MPNHPLTTLRYFDARGRGQFLRYYLLARNIPFTDERVALAADFAPWVAIRDDGRKTGPFHKLPVLHWGDKTIAETLVIGAFLHDACGDEAMLSARDNLRHAMLISSLYGDVMFQLGTLIWSDIAYPGVDVRALTARILERLGTHFERLNETLATWRWLADAKSRPIMLADCLLWEEIDVARYIFRTRLEMDRYPLLGEFYRGCAARAVFEKLLVEHPCQISARPGEAEFVASLHAMPAAVGQ